MSKLRFIALDFPGHGQSSHLPPGQWYHWTDYLGSVIRTVDYLKVDKVSLIAHSLGGSVACIYAGTYPDKVNRLVLVDICRPLLISRRMEILETSDSIAQMYRSFYDQQFQFENGQSKFCVNPGLPMEKHVSKLMRSTRYLEFMTVESAEILVKRVTRLTSKDPELYSLTRDPRLLINDYFVHDSMANECVTNMICDMLIILPENGIIKKLFPKEVGFATEIYEKILKVFKVATVKGFHHEHLNNPTEMALLMAEFLLSSE